MTLQVSHAEVVDKFTILLMKMSKARSELDRGVVGRELAAVQEVMACLQHQNREAIHQAAFALGDVNAKLWALEDGVRVPDLDDCTLGRLAREIFALNDERARLKRDLNRASGSDITEVKIRPLPVGDEVPRASEDGSTCGLPRLDVAMHRAISVQTHEFDQPTI